MKIVLTGGGSGGHFYPLIAVAEQLRQLAREERLLDPKLIYMAPTEYDPDALFEHDIIFKQTTSGKQRNYRSILNFIDLGKIAWGVLQATLKLFFLFPDVVFSKGGYASVPVVFAARLFGIPVIFHESDSVPGKANAWAAKFASRIAVSYPGTVDAFRALSKRKGKQATIAVTGNPVRKDLVTLVETGAREFLKIEDDVPVVLVLGGSQGAQTINEAVVEALPELVQKYYVIHQTGKELFDITKESAALALSESPLKDRYKPFPFLNVLAMRMSAGTASLVISRAGSNSIFEIAIWGKPSVIIPIPEDVSRDQRSNAFAYARTGAAVVVEQANLTPHLLVSEVDRLMGDEGLRKQMSEAARGFARPDASAKIAREIIDLALEHEK
ncbi:MAG TPA: UDP-N-acetylglucosamine--N-acetylmuramyl-(pentapeptide) pyrophosphoryl-undecaprenol N-acetylglucosamine transferase [Candidatus Paceibacterota bacterium]|nr:UDP-N-acetylglucosamine--N-acetylmuramyl-(pentapeptide) pyrophosphoryl-undecaprenol N-acetylglucosamine transferase [Candidatus Paceibacterota bacterium]